MMMMMEVSCFLTVACLLLFCVPSGGLNVACFYTNWAQYRVGEAKFTVSNINASLCTHINFGFAKLAGNNISEYEYNDKDMWRQLKALKQINPSLKTFLSVGGASLSGPFSNMVSSQDNRNAFINSVILTLRGNGFDGLDIDWEYPAATDKQNLRILTQEMASAFETDGQKTGRPRLLLSFSVPAGISTIDNGYDIIGMNSYVTFWNVMAYDYHGSWEWTVNLHTPLNDQGDKLSVSSTVDHYLALGASVEKLILGLAFYARTWAVSGSISSIGSPANGPGAAGTFTKTPGVLAYYEVCDFIRTSGMTPQYENTYGYVNYGAKNGQWIGYEALNSLEAKMKFIERKSLGGAMIWTLDFDDFSGRFCGQGTFPLTTLVSSRILSIAPNVSTSTTAASNTTSANTTTTNTTPTTTTVTSTSTTKVSSAPNSTVCRTKYGFFPDNGDCSYYLVCENGTVTRRIRCVNNTIFNPNTKTCESLANTTYTCPNQTSTTTTVATTTAPATTASTTAPTTTASTAAPTTTSSTAAPTSTASTTASTTTASTAAPTTTASTTAPTTTVLTPSTAAVTPKSQNNTANPCNFTCPSRFGIFANTDCTVYNVCYYGRPSCMRCPSDQIYNPETTKCELVSTSTYKCPS